MDLGDKVKQTYADQSPEEVDIVNHVKQKLEDSKNASNRVAAESIWMRNCAYVLGLDGVTYNSVTRSFQPINQVNAVIKKNRLHMNKILPTLQNRLAKLAKNPPRYDIAPESNDTEDKEAARVALQILNGMWKKLNLDEKRLALYMWVQQCGHAYIKVSWDDQLGNPITDPETGEFGYEGDVRVDICSPFEIYPDPLAKTFDDVSRSWLIQTKIRKLDYFKSHYPEKGHLVKEEDVYLMGLQYEQRINTMNQRGSSSGGVQDMKNAAIEVIKYEARSKEHPNGRMIVTANGILLADKELPTGEIPFAKFDDIIVGGKYYSEAITTHLVPIQDQYNQTIRRRAEWTNRLLNGKYVVARGTGIKQEQMNDQSGEIVAYTPIPTAPDGGRPQAMQIPMIPQWAYNETDYLDRMFNEVSGISEISKGNLPSASIPAIGMQLLVEQDDSRVGTVTEQHERAWARIGYLILKYVEKMYVVPRKLKLTGKQMEYAVLEVTGDQLKGNTDVYVIRGSTLPGSKSLRRQDILNAYSQGLLGDPADPRVREKVLGLIEFGDVQGIWEDYALDMNQIQRGIDQMEKGIPVIVSELDNHALWIQELNKYRKNAKFDRLNPAIQSIFLQNIDEHLDWIMQQSGAIPPSVDAQQMALQEPEMMSPEEQNASEQLSQLGTNEESELGFTEGV